jgi:hypothetical protein
MKQTFRMGVQHRLNPLHIYAFIYNQFNYKVDLK